MTLPLSKASEASSSTDDLTRMSNVCPSFSLSSFAPLTIDAKGLPSSHIAIDLATPLTNEAGAPSPRWLTTQAVWLTSPAVQYGVTAAFVLLAVLLVLLAQLVASSSSAALLLLSIAFPLVMAAFASFTLVSLHQARHQSAPSGPTATHATSHTASPHSASQQSLSVLGFFLDKLNNPLHRILSLLQFLQDSKPSPSQPASRSADEEEIVCSIREQALVMQSIVADALDLRTVDPLLPAHSPLVHSTGVHWPSLVSSLLVPLQQQAAQRQVSVTSAVEAGLGVMYGDCRRLQQCVSLLLSNVVGLTNEGGSVSVRVKAVRPREEKAEERRAEDKRECDCASGSGMRRSASLRGINLSCPSPSPHSKLRRALRIETDQSKLALGSPASVPNRRLRSQHTTSSSPSAISVSTVSSASSVAATGTVTVPSRPTIAMQLKVHTSTRIRRQQLAQLVLPFHVLNSTTSLNTPSPLADVHSLSLVCRFVQSLGGSVEVRCDGAGTAFVLYFSFALTPAGDGLDVSRDALVSPLPGQSPKRVDGEGAGELERSEDEYTVLMRSSDDGVEVEDVTNSHLSVSSRRSMADDATLAASPLARARTTPLNASRRMLAEGAEKDNVKGEQEPEDDNKSIELTALHQSRVSSADAVPSLPLYSFSPFGYAENTPLSSFRASQTLETPSASPLSALSSMSASSFQLHTPSPLLGRSFTEAAPSSASSPASSVSVPAYRASLSHHGAFSSLSSATSSFLAGSSVSADTPVSGHARRRSGLSSEMSLMTRQVAEARLKLRQSDGTLVHGEQAAAMVHPLSLLAAPRRLIERVPTLDMADGGSELLGGRTVSAPGSSTIVQPRSLHSIDGTAGDASSAMSPLLPERIVTSVRSQTTTIIRPNNAPSTAPGPTRAVSSAHVALHGALPANYSLHSPQTSISAVLSLSSSLSSYPLAAASSFSAASASALASTPFSATPPLVPRQRTPRPSEDEKLAAAVRAQLSSLSVLVVDDSEINLKIALRMLQGIDCETAMDGREAVDAWRRRAVSGGPVSGEEKKGSPQLSASSAPASATMPAMSSAARAQSAALSSSTTLAPAASSVSAEPFSLILCDIVMPVSGLDATRAIRALEKRHALPHTPIVAVTANCTRSDRREAKAAGMDYLLAKPFTRQQLFEVMQLAMKEKGLPKDASREL